jgi:MoaA/NifB/PqqE/SkfB family radical SAM enzyme
MEHIISLNLKSTLISNLTLVKDKVHFLEHLPDTILANFSAADPESYVAFHPSQKHKDFDKLLVLLESISSKKKCSLKLVYVVCNMNHHLIDKALNIAAGLNAAIQFKLMSPSDFNAELILSPETKNMLSIQCNALQIKADKLNVHCNLGTLKTQLSGEHLHDYPIEKTGCYAGYYYSRIRADGSVWYCCNPNSGLRCGSLHQQSFTEIWNSEPYQNIRNNMRNGQFVTGCNACGKFQMNASKSESYKESLS